MSSKATPERSSSGVSRVRSSVGQASFHVVAPTPPSDNMKAATCAYHLVAGFVQFPSAFGLNA